MTTPAIDGVRRVAQRHTLRDRTVLWRQEIARSALIRYPERGYRFEGWRLERRDQRLVDPRGTSVTLRSSDMAKNNFRLPRGSRRTGWPSALRWSVRRPHSCADVGFCSYWSPIPKVLPISAQYVD